MMNLQKTDRQSDWETEDEDDEWVEISDIEGHRASLRLLATIREGNQIYHVLSAYREPEEGEDEGEGGIILVREDKVADGAQEYVVADDEQEIERVMTHFVMNAMMMQAMSVQDEESGDRITPCGMPHKFGEFCYCDKPDMLQ